MDIIRSYGEIKGEINRLERIGTPAAREQIRVLEQRLTRDDVEKYYEYAQDEDCIDQSLYGPAMDAALWLEDEMEKRPSLRGKT